MVHTRHRLSWLFVAFIVGSAGAATPETLAPPSEVDAARYAVWTAPLVPASPFSGIKPLVFAVGGVVGFDFSIRRVPAVLELAGHYAPGWEDGSHVGNSGWGGSIKLGIKWAPWSEHHLRGLFITVSGLLGYATTAYGLNSERLINANGFPGSNQEVVDLHAAVTLGYQWIAWKHLYVATALGCSTGLTWAPRPLDGTRAYWAGPYLRSPGLVRELSNTVQFDLSLLRVGFAW